MCPVHPHRYFRQRSGSGQEWQATVLGWVRQDLKLAAVLLDELGLETVVKVGGVRGGGARGGGA
jgi:hypothetical protein